MVVMLDGRGRKLRIGDPCVAEVMEDLTVPAVVVGPGQIDDFVVISVPPDAHEEYPQRFDLPLARVLLRERA